jgi:hypothetical protein
MLCGRVSKQGHEPEYCKHDYCCVEHKARDPQFANPPQRPAPCAMPFTRARAANNHNLNTHTEVTDRKPCISISPSMRLFA